MWRCSLAVNQNGFNSRVTSEALEERFRQVFPAQAGAELIQDLYASGVIVPTIDFTSVAEGSFLPEILQTAWDFATDHYFDDQAGTSTLFTGTGFWLVDVLANGAATSQAPRSAKIEIDDGSSQKVIWQANTTQLGANLGSYSAEQKFVVFMRAGDSLTLTLSNTGFIGVNVWWRQIASVNGVLVNPLGFSF